MASLGVNLRVTAADNQGGRKYMEDTSVTKYINSDDGELLFAFFGIYDGHGGWEASKFAKEHLLDTIMKQKTFYSDDDEQVLKAIREGFLATQQAMWKDLPNWKKTNSGLPSTAGTTASVCFVKRGKLFIGHVGDSGIVLGERDPHHPVRWRAKPLTRDHKPDCEIELERIHKAGGKVIAKSGVPRVVWYRPTAHQGPVRRSTHIEEVPFLAVARSLGDLWSYNSKEDVFVVSPDPDCHVVDINVLKDRCLVFASDGLWNVVSPAMAIQSVFDTERHNEPCMIDPLAGHPWLNPSKRLVDLALSRWNMFNLRADNVSVVTVMLDPPGPVRGQVLRRLYNIESNRAKVLDPTVAALQKINYNEADFSAEQLQKGNSLISRMPNSRNENNRLGLNLMANKESWTNDIIRVPRDVASTANASTSTSTVAESVDAKEKLAEEPSSTVGSDTTSPITHVDKPTVEKVDAKIQCSEVSSSDNECDSPAPPPVPSRPPGGHRSSVPTTRRSMLQSTESSSTMTSGPMTRTRQQSGQNVQQPKPAAVSPPPLPVKPIRRSIVPGYSGYNSDSENQSGQANEAAHVGRRHLRSSHAATPPTTVLTPTAVNSNIRKALRRPDAPASLTQPAPAKDCTTPDRNMTDAVVNRVLRSRNTPLQQLTQSPRCSQRARPTPLTPSALSQKPTLPETGIKRKRRSHETGCGVPSLAAKMLKMSHARTTSWLNPSTRRSTAAMKPMK